MKSLKDLRVKIFADGADLETIKELYANDTVKGYTTNPTILRKAGIQDYEWFAKQFIEYVPDLPISFEVFADDFEDMERQARLISSWGSNVYVKIPITNTKGQSSLPLVRRLSSQNIKINITAIMDWDQVVVSCRALEGDTPAYISVFGGRIADTGRDPVSRINEILGRVYRYPNIEVIWASPRELLNIFQADRIGCHIITVGPDILAKLPLIGKDLEEYSLETVKMFRDDAMKSGFKL
jgi:transaldolase